MLLYSSTIAFVLSATVTWASQVCSPDTCLDGKSSSPLLAHEASGSKHYVPGTYTDVQSDFKASETLNITRPSDSSTLTVSAPSRPVGFARSTYAGDEEVWKDGNWSLSDWKSVYLPGGWYGVLEGGKVIRGAVPEKGQLPNDLTGLTLTKAASSACTPACSSHGTCVPSDGDATCECATGWTGKSCGQCATGYWGPTCAAGPTNCTIWDDGILGTGACLGAASSSQSTCNCEHGTCTSSTECTCAAGWTSNTTSALCNTCAEGFFEDSKGNCLACALGCERCTLQSGTENTPTCVSCADRLSLSSGSPATCTASSGSCADGTYYDTADSTCKSCSPACSTCTGPAPSDCLSCASPRVNLQGQCVYYDASNGVCDSSLSTLTGSYVVHNEKSRCDSCPSGCLDCHIPSFSNIKQYTDLTCSSCQEGWLLQDGKCVKTCDDGWFAPLGSAKGNGTCERCDSSCTTCQSTSTTCTSCPSPLSASSGSCVPSSSCPSSTTPHNGTCTPCPADCESCSSPNECTACPSSRPAMSSGRCIEYCPVDEYFDASKGSCQSCDWRCASCSSSGEKSCTSCPDGYKLENGGCVAANCGNGGFAKAYGVCLSDFVEKGGKRWPFALFAIIALVIAAALGLRWYVTRERKKTRAATKEFGDRMEDRNVSERLRILRLERVLGMERVRIGMPNPRDGEGRFEQSRAKRFRELLLPSRRRGNTDVEMDVRKTNFAPDRDSLWAAPPPPYVPSTSSSSTFPADTKARPAALSLQPRRDSLDSIPTPVLPSFVSSPIRRSTDPRPSAQRQDTSSTTIHSMSSPPLLSSMTSLMPPPRPGMSRVPSHTMDRETEREVRRSIRDGDGGEADLERRLKELWPSLRRKDEGWI